MSDLTTQIRSIPALMSFRRGLRLALRYEVLAKRSIDVGLSFLLLPVLVPVIAGLYIVARSDGGPGFFGHVRVGRGGRPFRCWKIRTMVPDAEQRLQAILDQDTAVREEWERDHKLRADPRVTRCGNFLRATSLDELPQIWNVILGDMSLVGPRPVTEVEYELYGPSKAAYASQRPGITGLWQVSGRNDLTYDERIALDVRYTERLSLFEDLRILCMTALAVVKRTGC